MEQVYLAQKMDEEDYLKVFFAVDMRQVEGEPKIMEPGKCGELRWVKRSELPEDTIPYMGEILGRIGAGERYGVV